MPKAIDTPTPTRRAVLGAATISLLAAPIAVTAAAPSDHPDAELLTLLAEFDGIERHLRAAYPSGCTCAEEQAFEEMTEPLRDLQHALIDRICSTPSRTIAGLRARARSLILYDNGMIGRPDDPDQYDDRRLIYALVRDMAGEG